MDKKQTIPLFFSCDNNYVTYMSVSITSIIENASKDYNYDIVVLYHNLSEDSLKKLKGMGKDNFNIITIPMDQKLTELTKTGLENLCTSYYSLSIYFRIFIPLMFPEYKKGIYLDSDIVVPGDISELYNMNLNNKALGAVADQSVQKVPVFVEYIEKGLGIPVDQYINSGILLMDLEKLRDLKFSHRFLEVLNKYHFETVAPDQDYINVLCKDQITLIPANWNTMSSEDVKTIQDPQIIHFNLFDKPWRYDHITYEEEFWYYAKKSVFYNDIVEYKNNYPDKKREIAKDYLKDMFLKAERISKKKETFAYYFNSGLEARI